MSTAISDNVLHLTPHGSSEEDEAGRAARHVRTQLSLLQGYADMMEGLSPQQKMHILKMMGERIRDLTIALQPFTGSSRKGAPLEDYRNARARHRQLMGDYRGLLRRLRESMDDAQLVSANQPVIS